MSEPKTAFPSRDNKPPSIRINERIRFSPVRVIDSRGDNLGIMATSVALERARQEGLDLVEIAPQARPPVCRIVEFGRYKYEQTLREKEQKQKQRQSIIQIKEVRFHPSIQEHDIQVKVSSIQKFLQEGHRVQIRVQFRKRENAHKDLGFKLVEDVINRVKDFGHPRQTPRMDGKDVQCLLEPIHGPQSARIQSS